MEQMQIDEGVDEGIQIGNRLSVAKMRTLNPQMNRLAVDPFDRSALAINVFVTLAIPIQSVTEPCANTGRHHGGTALVLFCCTFMMNGTGLSSWLRKE